MNLSVSNIGWTAKEDDLVYSLMKKYGFHGLEIAPTRIFPREPYLKLKEIKKWAEELEKKHGFLIPSMQSIWFERQEKIFDSAEKRRILADYTKKAVDFAVEAGCQNLVFGCPRNRVIPEGADELISIHFFKEIGDYAASRGTVIGMEANPPIYNTNYINSTASALELIDKVDSKGFRLNLDLGTMIQNEESVTELYGKVHLISHVHISEPGLKPIQERLLHRDLKQLLINENYQMFVSIEMSRTDDLFSIEHAMQYIGKLFCQD